MTDEQLQAAVAVEVAHRAAGAVAADLDGVPDVDLDPRVVRAREELVLARDVVEEELLLAARKVSGYL